MGPSYQAVASVVRVPAMASLPRATGRSLTLEYIGDTGAGLHIGSEEALVALGWPASVIREAAGPASHKVTFQTGNGDVPCNRSIGISSPSIGHSELYLLDKSPVAFSLGKKVVDINRPFVWWHPDLPWHCTDPSKLRISCPMRYRHYAHRVRQNVPIFKEEVTIGPRVVAPNAVHYFGAAAGVADDENIPSEEHMKSLSEELDEQVRVPDVPVPEPEKGSSPDDPSLGYRSMSKRALLKEARSKEHMSSHFPHNPLCEVCVRAHLRQRRYARKSDKDDDQLAPATGPWQQLGCDFIVVSKTREGGTGKIANLSVNGHSTIFILRDQYTGSSVGFPMKERSSDAVYKACRAFMGVHFNNTLILVKHDVSREIIKAIEDLGWISEPSMANRWPHNTYIERHVSTFESVIRAQHSQSGAPAEAWDSAAVYSSVSLMVTAKAPIYPHEQDDKGNVLPAHQHKVGKTCWQVQHRGEAFTGPLEPFGRLCYYRDIKKKHPLQPTASPGLFVGWRLDTGLRYRGVLLVLDYERARAHGWRNNFVRSCPEKEVHFPAEVVFPYAVAAEERLRTLKDVSPAEAKPLELPFSPQEEAAARPVPSSEARLEQSLAEAPPFRITARRIADFGPTPGCDACTCPGIGLIHTDECRIRFRSELERAGELAPVVYRFDPVPRGEGSTSRPSPAEDGVATPPAGDEEDIFGQDSGGEGPLPQVPESRQDEIAAAHEVAECPLFSDVLEDPRTPGDADVPHGTSASGVPSDSAPALPARRPRGVPRGSRSDAGVDVTYPASRQGQYLVQRLRPSAVVPTRGSDQAAGLDLYAAEDAFLPAGEQVTVGTGLVMSVPYGTYGRIAPRSGLTIKYCIGVGAGVIDHDFRGEVGVVLYNYGKADYSVRTGDRIAQLILEQCLIRDPIEVHSMVDTQRGSNGFGSTGQGRVPASVSTVDRMLADPPKAGAYAAVEGVERVLSDAMAAFEAQERRILFNETADKVKLAMALDKTERSLRPSKKLAGYGTVVEVGCEDTSPSVKIGGEGTSLQSIRGDYDDIKAFHTFPASGFTDPKWATAMRETATAQPGTYLIGTVPHKVWSPSEWAKVKRSGPEYLKGLQEKRTKSLQHLQELLDTGDAVLRQGGEFTLHAPADSSLWLRPEVLSYVCRHELYTQEVEISEEEDGPRDTTPKVLWRYVTSNKGTALNLREFNPKKFKGKTALPRIVRNWTSVGHILLTSMYGYSAIAPAMPVVAHVLQEMHRENDGSEGVPLTVTKLLDRREWKDDEKALGAVRDEGAKLLRTGTWLPDSVREKDDLIAESKSTGHKIHLGQLMTICSIKFAELSADQQKYKGRIVFRGDCVKDAEGQAAVFQELSAQPTSIHAANMNLAFGCLPGNKTTQADAIAAYVQAKLDSKYPTWVLVPYELWPPEWKKKGYKKPMCRLDKSLYGHPESGGHWERHLTRIIKAMGGKPVPSHPSSFWFPKETLLLTVYVDDLLLSGPEKAHDAFWKRLGADVDLDPYEPLNRFIGRDHQVLDKTAKGTTLGFNMTEFAQQAVDQYSKLTGVTKFRRASTPFCPDGSLPLTGECEKGALSGVACAILMKNLWLARLARPDIQKPIGDLASRLTVWSRNDDKRLYRLICYLNDTKGHRLVCRVGDPASALKLRLYVDADFAGENDSTKSTNGGFLVLVGPNTWFPIAWVAKRQTATSRSTTEAEVISLAYSLFQEALPALDLWDLLLGRPMALEIMEDNQATIKVVKNGYSPKLRHVSRTHKVDLGSVYEVVEQENVDLKYVDTLLQAADIFTKALGPNKWENALALLGLYPEEQLKVSFPLVKI